MQKLLRQLDTVPEAAVVISIGSHLDTIPADGRQIGGFKPETFQSGTKEKAHLAPCLKYDFYNVKNIAKNIKNN